MILLISVCKEKLHELEFVNPVKKILNENHIKSFTKNYMELSYNDLQKADKIIICGTSLGDFDYFNHESKFRWIKDYTKPILGICAGMQVIINQLEGKNILDKTEIGMTKIHFEKEFLGIPEGNIEVYELHQSGIIKIGKDFEVYAESDNGIQAIKHKSKNIFGILFHPEVRNKVLIEKFAKL